MPVPEAIRLVPRPTNTVVCDNGNEHSRLRWCVRARKPGAVHKNGRSMPLNGSVIGHIIDGRFVPKLGYMDAAPQFLSFGSAALVHAAAGDIFSDLLQCFHPHEAQDILVSAMLRVLNPHIKIKRYSTEFKTSYLSVWYPDTRLSSNTVVSLLQKLGMHADKRRKFNSLRLQQVCKEHHIAIDGTLKQDSSRVNNFSAFSHKAPTRGVQDISILYAFDVETKEPLCAEVFQGNSIDATSYSAFIRDNSISRGIVLTDKGFPYAAAKREFADRPDLHYLTPIKRNDKRIDEYALLAFDDQLYGVDAEVVCKKVQAADGTYLYSLRDNRRQSLESSSFLKRTRKEHNFDKTAYQKKQDRFGLIVFESDLDMSCRDVWKCFFQRWLIELMFRQYKSCEGLTTTNVQNDFSVQGSEFVNFIATILTSRITLKMENAHLLDNDSYGDIMRDLEQVRRSVKAPQEVLPDAGDGYWDQNPLREAMEKMEKLGICKPQATPVKPHGHPGRPPKDAAAKQQKKEDAPKRGPGRPRIHPKPDPNAPKRGRGRPRKNPQQEAVPKRPVGRPRIHPKPDPNTPKRGRGRPPKVRPEPAEAGEVVK